MGTLSEKSQGICSSSKDGVLLQEFEDIKSNFCERLVQSMPNGLKIVVKNKGLHTKYQFI